jgi:putative peptidoglycan binding protein
MNAKKLVVFTVALGLFAISSANVHAQMHRNTGFVSHASPSHSFVRTSNWGGGNWGGNWHHHDHHDNSFIFISGFPFFGFGYPFGYPYGYGYGGYYPYGGYPYYGGGYYGGGYYGNGYYGGGYYGTTGYSSPGYSYGSGYGHQSSVVRLQQQLARAGYYRGPIDGIMGPRTRYALRAYQHDHGAGTYGMTDR